MSNNYYIDKYLKPGSSFYYSLIYLPESQRHAFTILRAIYEELREIPATCKDPGVARIKLHWWQEEINKAFISEPDHPLAKSLQSLISEYSLEQNLFNNLIDAVYKQISPSPIISIDDLKLHAEETLANYFKLTTNITHANHSENQDLINALAFTHTLFNSIRYLRAHAKQQYLWLPENLISEFKVDINSIFQNKSSTELKNLLRYLHELALEHYQNTSATFKSNERKNCLALILYTELKLAQMKEIARGGYEVLQQEIHLTPLRKLMVSWTVRRREKRQQPTGKQFPLEASK